MKKLALVRHQEGAAAIEMAIALPVLILFIWGIFQIGIAGQAVAGMQAGLGEGARLGTICVNPTGTGSCSVPSDDEIKQRVKDKVFGLKIGTFDDPVVSTPDPAVCTNCRDLSVTFNMPTNFLFFQGPTLHLTQSKRIYMAT